MSTLPWRRAVPVMPMGRARVPVPVMLPMGWRRVPVPLPRGRGVTGLARLSRYLCVPRRRLRVATVARLIAGAWIRRPIASVTLIRRRRLVPLLLLVVLTI